MPTVTPRATVVQAIAKREAELLGQTATSGHVLVALVWEGGGVAASVLEQLGVPKGAEVAIRRSLRGAREGERGMAADELLSAAGTEAVALGHGHIGTEHQLLATVRDRALGDSVLSSHARARARAGVLATVNGLKDPE